MIPAYQAVAEAYTAQAELDKKRSVILAEQAELNAKFASSFKELSEADALLMVSKAKPSEANAPKESASSAEEKPPITFEEVRKVLARKSVDGFTDEIRGIIGKYGAKKLSDLDSDCYEPLLAEVEALGHGG